MTYWKVKYQHSRASTENRWGDALNRNSRYFQIVLVIIALLEYLFYGPVLLLKETNACSLPNIYLVKWKPFPIYATRPSLCSILYHIPDPITRPFVISNATYYHMKHCPIHQLDLISHPNRIAFGYVSWVVFIHLDCVKAVDACGTHHSTFSGIVFWFFWRKWYRPSSTAKSFYFQGQFRENIPA